MKKLALLLSMLILITLALSACSSAPAPAATPTSVPPTATAEPTQEPVDQCAPENLPLFEKGKLTVATGEPVYPPWMIDDDPSNGKGFESAVVYAIAKELGIAPENVQWVRTDFDEAISPVEKDYDFNIQQYTITDEREKIIDFSVPYYYVNKALVTLKDSPAANVKTFDDLKDIKFGATVGTTDLAYIEDVIGAKDVAVYNTEVDVVSAMDAGQIDATVIGLPTAFYITAVQLDNGVIAGVFPSDDNEGFGLLFTEGSELKPCVDAAIEKLRADGTLDKLAEEWLQGGGDIPTISK